MESRKDLPTAYPYGMRDMYSWLLAQGSVGDALARRERPRGVSTCSPAERSPSTRHPRRVRQPTIGLDVFLAGI